MTDQLNRRTFIKASLFTAVGAALAGCTAPQPVAKPEGEPQAAPAKGDVTLVISRGEHPSQPILGDAPAHKAQAEATGIKLDFQPVPGADYTTKLKLWMSTKQVPDIIYAAFNDIRDYADPSVFMPVLPLVDKHAPNIKKYLEAYPEAVKKLRMNGELFILPATSYNTKRLSPNPCIRKDLLDAIGAPVPDSFDSLAEVLAEIKKAYPDTLGWTARKPGTQSGIKRQLMITAYPFGSGVGGWSRGIDSLYWEETVDGGKWLYGQIHDEFKEVLAYYSKLYADKLLDPDFAITTADQWHEKNSAGKGVFAWDNFSFCVRWNQAVRGIDPDATWAPIPTLAGTKGPRQNDYTGFAGSGGGWCISAKCKNPEEAIKLFDWKLSPLGLDVSSWGIQDTHYTLNGARPESITDYSTKNLETVMSKSQRALKPEVVTEYAEKADPFRSYQSATGTGQLDFALLWDDAVIYTWDKPGEADEWYAMSASDPGLHPEIMLPSFTKEESERIKQIFTDVNAILDPLIDKVVTGQATMAEWEAGVVAAKKAGAEELEKIHNEAEVRG
jgi:ABC-type glycerol-3-phosphate transport system substrate-binding protein